MIYAIKSVYKGVSKYECRQKSCKARINLLPDGKCVLAKKYVQHNHEHEEEAYRELKALNNIKKVAKIWQELLAPLRPILVL